MKGVDGKTFEVINPSDESVICSVHEASEKDVDIAVSAARKAFEGEWRKVTPGDRGRMLTKLADLFEENIDLLAAVEALDNGKAVSMAKGDVGASAGCLRVSSNLDWNTCHVANIQPCSTTVAGPTRSRARSLTPHPTLSTTSGRNR